MIRILSLAIAVLFAAFSPSFAQVCSDDIPPPPPPVDKPVS